MLTVEYAYSSAILHLTSSLVAQTPFTALSLSRGDVPNDTNAYGIAIAMLSAGKEQLLSQWFCSRFLYLLGLFSISYKAPYCPIKRLHCIHELLSLSDSSLCLALCLYELLVQQS